MRPAMRAGATRGLVFLKKGWAAEAATARRIAGALLILLVAIVGGQIYAGYQAALTHTRTLLTAQTQSLAFLVGGSLRSIDGLLVDMQMAVRQGQWRDSGQVRRLEGRLEAFPEVLWVGLVSPQGVLSADTVPSIGLTAAGLDVHDRRYFREAAADAAEGVHVGDPTLGRSTGQRTLHLARAVHGADGRLLGVVVVAVSADYFAQVLSSLLLDPDGGAALLRDNGRVVARAPDHIGKFGLDVSDSVLFRRELRRHAQGVAALVAKVDGHDKYLGYARLGTFPLVVTVGQSRVHALSGWLRETLVEGGVFAIFAAALYFWADQADLRAEGLRRSQRDLEGKVAERTAELAAAMARVEEGARRLETVNEKLRRLAHVSAHHLQEPLRPMVSFSQLARRGLKGTMPRVDEYLAFVENGARRQKAVLLALQRYTAVLGDPLRLGMVDLGAVAHAEVAALSPLIERVGGIVRIDSLPKVMADRGQMVEMMRELLRNALIHHRPDRPPRVSVSGAVEDGRWWLEVADNGGGFREEALDHLFEPFSAADASDPEVVGLGLALCRAIAEAHGGSVTVASGPDGSRIAVMVPMIDP